MLLKKLKIAFVLLIILSTAKLYSQQKPRIAVILYKSINISPAEQQKIMGYIEQAITLNGNFTLLEREAIQKILNEHQFSANALIDRRYTARIGRFIPPNKIVAVYLSQENGKYLIILKYMDVERAILESVAINPSSDSALEEVSKKTVTELLANRVTLTREKQRVSVLDLDYKEFRGTEAQKQSILSYIEMEVVKSNQYILLERNAVNAIIQEQNLSQSDLMDETKRIRLGKLLGSKKIITGSLTGVASVHYLKLILTDIETSERSRTVTEENKGDWSLNETARVTAQKLLGIYKSKRIRLGLRINYVLNMAAPKFVLSHGFSASALFEYSFSPYLRIEAGAGIALRSFKDNELPVTVTYLVFELPIIIKIFPRRTGFWWGGGVNFTYHLSQKVNFYEDVSYYQNSPSLKLGQNKFYIRPVIGTGFEILNTEKLSLGINLLISSEIITFAEIPENRVFYNHEYKQVSKKTIVGIYIEFGITILFQL